MHISSKYQLLVSVASNNQHEKTISVDPYHGLILLKRIRPFYVYFLHTHKDVHETKHVHANTVTYLCCLTGGTNEPRRLLASEQSAALPFK